MTHRLKSLGRDRATLHPKHLEAFKQYAQALGYTILPNTKHPYNVLHIRLDIPSGQGENLLFYRNDKRMRITVPEGANKLVQDFIDYCRSRRETIDQ